MKWTRNTLIRLGAAVSTAGLVLAALGLWIPCEPLYLAGLLLALPLYAVVLPALIGLLACAMTRPLWLPFYRLAIRRRKMEIIPGKQK